MTAVALTEMEATGRVDRDRKRLVIGFGALLAVSLGFDASVYPGNLTHVYVHDGATLVAAVIGLVLAVRRRSLLPASRGSWVPLAFLGLLALNTVILGAVEYSAVPAAMHKLFWFEHGDALRIIGELGIWIWAFGQLDPHADELWAILDIALWGGIVTVVLAAGYWLLYQIAHIATTPYDLTIMFGLPLSAVFVLRRGAQRADLVRLGIYGGGSLLLYSRTAIIVVALSTLGVLVAVRGWRKIALLLAPVVAGWVVVAALTLAIGLNPGISNGIHVDAPPGAAGATAAGSSARMTLLRLASLGDSQIAGYTLPSRFVIWRDAFSMFKRSPIFGVGYHDYFLYSTITEIKTGSNLDPADLFSSRIKQAHNDYLSFLAETGLIGLLVYVGLWALIVAAAAKLWLADAPNRAWHGFMLGFLVGLAGVSLFGEVLIPRTPSWIPTASVWWILIAFLLIDLDRRYGWLRRPRH